MQGISSVEQWEYINLLQCGHQHHGPWSMAGRSIQKLIEVWRQLCMEYCTLSGPQSPCWQTDSNLAEAHKCKA